MIFPVRCFSCGKLIGDKWNTYVALREGKNDEQVFRELGIDRMCCRRMFLSHVELIDKLIEYNYL